MMDENEHSILSHIPMRSLSLRLARSTIKMTHDNSWQVDKVNPVHDLIICLSGSGNYLIGDDSKRIDLTQGDALLIPAFTRFRGSHAGGYEQFIGIAQHFSLELFGRGDLIQKMSIKRSVHLPNWETLQSLTQHFRQTAPHGSTTLIQHHQFMVLLLAFLETAFISWKTIDETADQQDHLSVQIMLVASRLSADPLGAGVEEALDTIPYHPEYFRRAFRERLGYTPLKFRELKRMEFAASRLGMGISVKATAAELGYSDPYFFSRMFKQYMGASPSTYREKPAFKP